MRRIAQECVPKFIFAENVSEYAINRAVMDLRADGYECTTTSYSAQDMGADHIRKRYWLLAYTNDNREFRSAFNAKAQKLPEFCPRVWETNPNEFRVSDGLAHRVDKLRAIGNGQVPCVAAAAFLKLWAAMLSGEC